MDESKAKRETHRLSPKQSFQAVMWLKAAEIGPGDTHKTLAYRTTEAMGFLVTEGMIKTLLDVAERELVKAPPRSKAPLRDQAERIKDLENQVANIYKITADLNQRLADTATREQNNQAVLIDLARFLFVSAHYHGGMSQQHTHEVDRLYGPVRNFLASVSAVPNFEMGRSLK